MIAAVHNMLLVALALPVMAWGLLVIASLAALAAVVWDI
jgi:hypothetical protein